MIRTNLSTRPFYNERAVQLWLFVLALIVAAATLFNVARVVRYSHRDTELATEASRDQARAVELRAAAARLRAGVDVRQIDLASAEARQANELIDRRTFSWTELFNQLETTLPDNVRITSVRPRVEGPDILVSMTVVARGVDDVDELLQKLEATGSFSKVRSEQDQVDEQGMLNATIVGTYVPGKKGA
jgi:Tfp pilus assembly protein PilN